MHLPQIAISLFLTFGPTFALPPGFLHRGFSSPSFYPTEFHSRPNTNLQQLSKRKSCAETCRTICYYQTTIDKAVQEGYSLLQAGRTEGSDDYPHAYNDYEGFSFEVAGPYYEFPIMHDFKAYDGGSPGPDRVVFNKDGELAGVITHTGASGNNFVECRE